MAWSDAGSGVPTVGILGGGQLARMLAQEAIRLGFWTSILDPDPKAPALALATRSTVGAFSDLEALQKMAAGCDVITYDLENIDIKTARALQAQGHSFSPSLDMLEIVQDKLHQKQHFLDAGLPVPEFKAVEDSATLGAFGWPVIQKARRAGYDGKGVRKLSSAEDTPLPGDTMIEHAVSIHKEISVLVARDGSGNIRAYPPVEMVFDPQLNLLDHLVAPGTLDPDWGAEAVELAEATVECLNAQGIVAVELFLDQAGKLWINEVAPRPHNSGHQTIEANVTNQFEQHLRAVIGAPLGSVRPLGPCAMANLLGSGTTTGPATVRGLTQTLALDGVRVHIYGKRTSRPGRKLGHITALDESIEGAVSKVKNARALISITGAPQGESND